MECRRAGAVPLLGGGRVLRGTGAVGGGHYTEGPAVGLDAVVPARLLHSGVAGAALVR